MYGDSKFRISAKQLGLIAFLPVLLLLSYFVLAAQDYSFTLQRNAPVDTNATEVFIQNPFINVSVNATTEDLIVCNWTFNNGSSPAMYPMTNGTNSSALTTYVWNSSIIVYKSNNRALRNVTFNCSDQANSDWQWYNTTTLNPLFFYINERAGNTSNITITGLVNQTTTAQNPTGINVTTNLTMTNCSVIYYDGNSSASPGWVNFTLKNSTNHTLFINSSILTTYLNQTKYGYTSNLSIKCVDAWGNETWSNCTSTPNPSQLHQFFFDFDPYGPWIGWQEYLQNSTVGNTSEAQYINVTYWFNDTHNDTCGAYVYNDTQDRTFWQGSLFGINTELDGNTMGNCTVSLWPENVTGDGLIVIEHWMNDTAGNSNTSAVNETFLKSTLPANKWTYVTLSDAAESTTMYLENITKEFPNATHISYWNNSYTAKNYTTYAVSTPTTNNETNISLGSAVVIYTSTASHYLRKNYLGEELGNETRSGEGDGGFKESNFTVFGGIKGCNGTDQLTSSGSSFASCTASGGNKTGWNLMGLFLNRTMNETLYACHNTTAPSKRCFNESAAHGPAYSGDLYNFSYVSWYNSSSGNQVTCKLGWTKCTGTKATVTTVVLRRDQSIWVLPNQGYNFTLNRTAY